MYDQEWGTAAVHRIFAEDEYIDDGFVAWEEIATLYEPLPAIVRALLCLDRRSHGLVVVWNQVIELMVTKGTCFA